MARSIGWSNNSGALAASIGEGTPHLIVLTACALILAGSVVLTPAQTQEDSIRLGPFALPGLCTFNHLTQLPCPGCGLVRSMVAATHGQIEASVTYHRLGLITLAYIFLQAIYRGLWLLLPSLRAGLLRGEKLLNRGFIVLGGLYVLNWGFTLSLLYFRSF
jgi:hypothetical protein